MRAVLALPLRAVTGQEPPGLRDLELPGLRDLELPDPRDPSDRPGPLASSTAGTPTSSAASDNSVRPSGPARPPNFGGPADPARPQSSGRPATPEDEAPGDVYVYRDTDGQPDDHVAAAQGREEDDAAYWYDLPGTGSAGDAPQVIQETRGPFEPLVSSGDPPGTTPRFSARPDAAEPAPPDAARSEEAPGTAGDGLQDTAHSHARKLEQIKDLYLTAEAIGEVNVDKHFDHLWPSSAS